MAIVQRVAHLSKLAFFLSLGIAAAFIDACSKGGSDEDGKRPDTSPGGSTPTGASVGGDTLASPSGTGSISSNSAGTTAEPSSALGGRTGTGAKPSPSRSGNGGLWDVICE